MTRFLTFMSALLLGTMAAADTHDQSLRAAFDAGELSGLHSVHLRMGGEVIMDAYFEGEDEAWGAPLGVQSHGPDTVHDLRSVTKSITALLYGIALEDGLVPPVDAPLVAQFPDYEDLLEDPVRAAITIEDALTMRMGTEWNENLPYTDPANSEIAMERADDRYRFVLDRPMVTEPGKIWNYNGGATTIIGKLIEDGSGMRLDAFAKETLFGPLGIETFEWVGWDGVPSAASGLRLRAPDLAKIGQMLIDGGVYDGTQMVPADWIETALSRKTSTGFELDYGYFWYMPPGNPPPWSAGFGNGGQRFSVNKGLDLVLVVYAGNYNQPNDWQLAVKVVEEHLAPIIRAKLAD